MQNQHSDLGPHIGKFSKVVFRETPNTPIEIRKGKLVGYDGEFVQLQSFQNVYLINRRHVIAIKVFGGGKHE